MKFHTWLRSESATCVIKNNYYFDVDLTSIRRQSDSNSDVEPTSNGRRNDVT